MYKDLFTKHTETLVNRISGLFILICDTVQTSRRSFRVKVYYLIVEEDHVPEATEITICSTTYRVFCWSSRPGLLSTDRVVSSGHSSSFRCTPRRTLRQARDGGTPSVPTSVPNCSGSSTRYSFRTPFFDWKQLNDCRLASKAHWQQLPCAHFVIMQIDRCFETIIELIEPLRW